MSTSFVSILTSTLPVGRQLSKTTFFPFKGDPEVKSTNNTKFLHPKTKDSEEKRKKKKKGLLSFILQITLSTEKHAVHGFVFVVVDTSSHKVRCIILLCSKQKYFSTNKTLLPMLIIVVYDVPRMGGHESHRN